MRLAGVDGLDGLFRFHRAQRELGAQPSTTDQLRASTVQAGEMKLAGNPQKLEEGNVLERQAFMVLDRKPCKQVEKGCHRLRI